MNIILALKKYKKKVDQELARFLNHKIKIARNVAPDTLLVVKQIREFTLPEGKRIRPALIYYGYKALGEKNEKAIINLSSGIELIHNFLLIHDDIMDRSKFRRKKPTLHTKFATTFRKFSKDPQHQGMSIALVVGDLASTFGYEIITKSNFDSQKKIGVLKKLTEILENVCYGQILDTMTKIKNKISEEEILKTYEYKTAKYTIEGPLHIGAILAGASKKDLKKFSQYSLPLGVAFQIQDDILEIFGDEKKTGKSPTSDLKEGIKTLLIAKAQELGTRKQNKILGGILGDPKISNKEINQVRQIIKDTGSLEYCKNLAKSLVKKAIKVIKGTSFEKESKEFLIELAKYTIKREY